MTENFQKTNQPLIKDRLALYTFSNLQKLDKLITLLVDYLQLKGLHLGKANRAIILIISKEQLKLKGLEILEVKGFVTILNGLIDSTLFTFPFEESLTAFSGPGSAQSYYHGSAKEERKKEWLEGVSFIYGLPVNELERNLIIECNSDDVYKILIDIQEDIKNILSSKNAGARQNVLIESVNKEPSKHHNDGGKILYFLEYRKGREIVINNKYQLSSKPRHMGSNDLILRYLFDHPRESFSKKQVEAAIGQALGKTTFNTMLNNLGFTGQLRKLFFLGVSQGGITFQNNLTDQDIAELKIDKNVLKKELSALQKFNG